MASKRVWTGLPLHITNVSLSNFDAVCEVAAEEGQIRPEDIERLRAFRSNPSDEGWIAVK